MASKWTAFLRTPVPPGPTAFRATGWMLKGLCALTCLVAAVLPGAFLLGALVLAMLGPAAWFLLALLFFTPILVVLLLLPTALYYGLFWWLAVRTEAAWSSQDARATTWGLGLAGMPLLGFVPWLVERTPLDIPLPAILPMTGPVPAGAGLDIAWTAFLTLAAFTWATVIPVLVPSARRTLRARGPIAYRCPGCRRMHYLHVLPATGALCPDCA